MQFVFSSLDMYAIRSIACCSLLLVDAAHTTSCASAASYSGPSSRGMGPLCKPPPTMNDYYPATLVQEVQALIDRESSDLGPVNAYSQIMEKLKGAKIAYTAEDVSPTLVMVHPDNRGKLGLNAHNVHRNGAMLKKVGADRGLLTKATCFELHPMGPKRKQQLEYNQALIDSSNGILLYMCMICHAYKHVHIYTYREIIIRRPLCSIKCS